MSKRVVVYAKVHGNDIFVPGIGSLGTTLPSNTKSVKISMSREPGGDLEVIVNGREIAIPAANLQLVVYGAEGTSTKAPETLVMNTKAKK